MTCRVICPSLRSGLFFSLIHVFCEASRNLRQWRLISIVCGVCVRVWGCKCECMRAGARLVQKMEYLDYHSCLSKRPGFTPECEWVHSTILGHSCCDRNITPFASMDSNSEFYIKILQSSIQMSKFNLTAMRWVTVIILHYVTFLIRIDKK